MDPLSITGTVLAIADVAFKLKESFTKVGDNDRQIKHLSQDVLFGLNDLQRFCSLHGENLGLSDALELEEAVNNLRRELLDAHEHCLKLVTPASGHLSAAKSNVKAWWNRSAIEAEILRMKEQIQACHLRFISFSSARTEHAVLILRQQQREHLHRLDDLLPTMLAEDFLGSTKLLRHGEPGYTPSSTEVDYFSLQVLKISSWYSEHSPSPGQISVPDDSLFHDDIRKEINYGAFQATFNAGLKLLHRVRQLPQWAYSREALYALDSIQRSCAILGYQVEYSLALCSLNCFHSIVTICAPPLAPVAWPPLPFSLTSNSLTVSKSFALKYADACRQAQARGFLLGKYLGTRLRRTAIKLGRIQEHEEALKLARESLDIQWSHADADGAGRLIKWKSSGGILSIYPSAKIIARPENMVYDDALCFSALANCLADCNYYAEARSVALEASACYRAIAFNKDSSPDNFWDKRADRLLDDVSKWFAIIPNPRPAPFLNSRLREAYKSTKAQAEKPLPPLPSSSSELIARKPRRRHPELRRKPRVLLQLA